jgi:hypothetical protein
LPLYYEGGRIFQRIRRLYFFNEFVPAIVIQMYCRRRRRRRSKVYWRRSRRTRGSRWW